MEVLTQTSARAKRKGHKKSRQGCRNCKLRKVKCDESKPGCHACRSYGVLCSYSGNGPDLQPPTQGWYTFGAENESALHPDIRDELPVICADDMSSLELDQDCLALLGRFRTITALTLGPTPMAALFREGLLRVAMNSPCLMHATLAITAIHDRYLAPVWTGVRSLAETYHCTECITLFNRKLSQPIRPQDRDPLWATAALLGTITFASFEGTTPEEAWPLKPPEESDLGWLRMCVGKMTVWNLTDPLRPDSLFSAMEGSYKDFFTPLPTVGVEGISPAVVDVCGLDETSTATSNPYFLSTHALAHLQSLPVGQITLTKVLTYRHHMLPMFRNLIHEKDPVALLLQAIWYKIACGAVWWMGKRADLEYRAIYIYLQRHYSDRNAIMELLLSS